MQMYLLTTYRIFNNFYIGITDYPSQRLIKNNETILPRFMLITIILIRGLYQANLHLKVYLLSYRTNFC